MPTYVHIALKDGQQVVVRENPENSHKMGQQVGIKFTPESIHLFDEKNG